MLKIPTPTQYELEMVTLEELVPQDHLLRLIDRHLIRSCCSRCCLLAICSGFARNGS